MKNEKKASKKAKAKEKKAGNDELDQALAELSLKYMFLLQIHTAIHHLYLSRYPELRKSTTSTPDGHTLANLLSISLAHLDPEAEMRKFFGSKVIQANKSSGPSSSRRQANAPAQRSHLTRPQATWWNANKREGLSMRALTEVEVREKEARGGLDAGGGAEEERWWTVEYSKRYKGMTKEFMQAVMAGGKYYLPSSEFLLKLPFRSRSILGSLNETPMARGHPPPAVRSLPPP